MADPNRRMYAAPFGMLSNPWPPSDPNQTPGFNVQPDTPPQTNPMASLLASFFPQQDLKQGIAENLGFPVDALGNALRKFGLPIPGNEAPPEWTPSQSGRQPSAYTRPMR